MTDPTAALAQIYDSFDPAARPSAISTEPWYHPGGEGFTLSAKFTPWAIDRPLEPLYVTVEEFVRLATLKDTFSDPSINPKDYRRARDQTNPYEKTGKSIFFNRAGVKLANIDSVHHVTGTVFTPLHLTEDKNFTFCDVAGGPGSFTQYLQYRYPNSKGYGITLSGVRGLEWGNWLDYRRFHTFTGPSNTGNLYLEAPNFISDVLGKEPEGVDLVVADGGFEVDAEGAESGQAHSSAYQQQEFLSSRLIVAECMVAVACTKIGGTAVIKVFDTVTGLTGELLFLLAQAFTRILLFKPISSRPASAEQYLLCEGRRINVQNGYEILSTIHQQFSDKVYSSTIIQQMIPDDFRRWLTASNDRIVAEQWLACANIIRVLAGEEVALPLVNTSTPLLLWNLPDEPIVSS